MTWSNGLTAARLLLTVPLVCAVFFEEWGMACACFWGAVATDLADGRVARARGEESAFGGVFDHATDALFVSSGLAVLALAGKVPLVLPVLVIAAFLQYLFDSKALSGRQLRMSVVGRWNGILYFVPPGIVVSQGALGLDAPADVWVLRIGWALVITTLISMADRAWAYRSLAREANEKPS